MAFFNQELDQVSKSDTRFSSRFRHFLVGRTFISLVFLAGVLIRLFLVGGASTNELISPDSSTYLEPARAFLDHLRFFTEVGSADFMFLRTPGYPTFLAGAIALLGDDVKRIALLQAFVMSFLILACYHMAKNLVSSKIALVVALSVALDPLLIYSSGRILTEGPHAVLLLLVGGALTIVARSPTARIKPFFMVGLAVSGATMIRPTTYYLPLLLLVLGAVMLWKRGIRAAEAARCLLVGVVPILIIVGGWQVRNEIRVDSSRFSGIESVNMYFYRAGGVIAEREGRAFEAVLNELLAEYPPRGRDESQGHYYDTMYDRGIEIVRKDLPDYAIVVAKAIPRMTLGESGMFLDYAGIPRNVVSVWGLRLFNLIVWSLWAATVCVAIFLPRWRPVVLALAIPTVYVILISAGAEAYSRFRTPVMPLVYLVCGIGLAIGGEFQKARRKSGSLVAAS